MAYIDEERKRRAGVELTDARKAWLAAAMEAQAKGLPLPPLPTETTGVRNPGDSGYVTPIGNERPAANQGQRVLSPAYTDPRSQAIAQTPGIIRPAHSMLDKIFRPGRADAANQMNREYLENALKNQSEQQYNQARTSSLQQDAAIKELQRRAMDGDPKALESLKEFYKAEALRRGGGGPTSDFYKQLAQEGSIDAGGGDDAVRRERGESPPPGAPAGGDDSTTGLPLTSVLPGNLTLSEARNRVETEIAKRQAQIDELDRELKSLDVEGTTRPGRVDWLTESTLDEYGADEPNVGIDLDWIAKRKQEIPIERAKLVKDKSILEEHRRRPAAERYSPTRATLE